MAFFGIPLLGAIGVRAIGAPPMVGPLLLVAIGVLWFVLAIRMVKGIGRDLGTDQGVSWHEVEIEAGGLLERRPWAALIPALFTYGWFVPLVGVAWLAFVNLIVAVCVLVALLLVFQLWSKRAAEKPPAP